MLTLITPQDLQVLLLQLMSAGGSEMTIVYRIKCPNATTQYIIDESFNLYGPNGVVIAKAGFAKVIPMQQWHEITSYNTQRLVNAKLFDNNCLFDVLQKEFSLSTKMPGDKNYVLVSNERYIKLSNREAECMQQLMYGRPIKVIARNLSLSPRTVESYLNTVKMKLNTSSLLELVCKIDNKDQIISWQFDKANLSVANS